MDVSFSERKNRFGELVDSAENGEPVIITEDRVAAMVVISYREYMRLNAKKGSLSELLLNAPLCGAEIDLNTRY
jgi:prevent-host-death family protein